MLLKKILAFVKGKSDNKKVIEHQKDVALINKTPEIRNISDFGTIKSAYLLWPWCLNDDLIIAEKAAKVFTVFFENDYYKKNNFNTYKYLEIKKSDLNKFDHFEEEMRLNFLCIASLNNNGYIREAALHALAEYNNPKALVFVLLRLNDWVKPVQQLAKNMVLPLVSKVPTRCLIQHHKYIESLLNAERNKLTSIYSKINEAIFSEKRIQIVLPSIKYYQSKDRFYFFRQLILQQKATPEIIQIILNDKMYNIRFLAIKNLPIEKDKQLLKKLLSDRNHKIKFYALTKLNDHDFEEFQNELKPLLFNTSMHVRQLARTKFSAYTDLDFREMYLNALKQKETLGHIYGLSEFGKIEDINLFKNALHNPQAKIRAAGIFAISNITIEQAKELAFKSLKEDNNIAVMKMSQQIILKEKNSNDLKKLRTIYNNTSSNYKGFILNMISKYGGSSVVVDFLNAILNDDEMLQKQAISLLAKWIDNPHSMATNSNQQEKEYILTLYQKINIDALKTSYEYKNKLKMISFIFDDR